MLLLALSTVNLFAEDTNNDIKIYDLSGIALELSGFNYFNIGLGHNWGTEKVVAYHSFANDYGFYIEYNTIKELHLRLYYDIYGGSAGMLLGGSGIAATNFDATTFGIAPHIGLGLGGIKIFYRYNFYLDKEFNCHEIVLTVLNDLFNENRRIK
jgi:hypothetical protein